MYFMYIYVRIATPLVCRRLFDYGIYGSILYIVHRPNLRGKILLLFFKNSPFLSLATDIHMGEIRVCPIEYPTNYH